MLERPGPLKTNLFQFVYGPTKICADRLHVARRYAVTIDDHCFFGGVAGLCAGTVLKDFPSGADVNPVSMCESARNIWKSSKEISFSIVA
jgi:hypothetical protein